MATNDQTSLSLNNNPDLKLGSNSLESNLYDIYNFDNRFITLIGNQPFYVEVYMYNQLPNFKPFAIPMFFIESLVIEETFDNWNTKGNLVLTNDFELLERGSLPQKDIEAIEASYILRSDGRNKLSIKIFPIIPEEIPKPEWEMAYDFIIYDIEDLRTDSASRKSRKFYFWDERFQTMIERNIEWSTGLYGNNKGNVLAKDLARAMPTSDAIKSIIQTTASNTSNPEHSDVIVGFSKIENNIKFDLNNNASGLGLSGPIESNSPEKMALFDDENWDKGFSGEEGLIQYTSPGNSNCLEDLGYVLSFFKSEDGTPAFLSVDRYDWPNGKKFKLISLKKYIDQSNDSQIERIVISDGQDPSNLPPYYPRASFDESTIIKNFQSGIASIINEYLFSPMLAIDEIHISNEPTHNYSFATGQFSINFTENSSKKFLEEMKKNASELYSFKKGNGQLMYIINQTKKSGLTLKNKFIPQTFYPKDLSRINMMKKFILLGQALHFRSPGLTLRAPGKFIFVDRDASIEYKNPFDDRFLGQWMITKVVHCFTRDKYTTDVMCTKVDLFNKWFEEEDSKY